MFPSKRLNISISKTFSSLKFYFSSECTLSVSLPLQVQLLMWSLTSGLRRLLSCRALLIKSKTRQSGPGPTWSSSAKSKISETIRYYDQPLSKHYPSSTGLSLIGGMGESGHADHFNDPPSHNHEEPACLPLPPRSGAVEAPHGEGRGDGPGLVHVSDQHGSHDQPEGISRGRGWVKFSFGVGWTLGAYVVDCFVLGVS